MLDQKKQNAMNLLIENKHNKSEICDIVGISRPTLYKWMEDEEFKAELDRRLQEIQLYGENCIKANVSKYIGNIDIIATTGKSEKTRLEANMYLTDRVLGKTTTKLQDVTDRNNDEDIDILAAIDEVDDDESTLN